MRRAAALALLCLATPVCATQPITQDWKPEPVAAVADSDVNRVAGAARSYAVSVVNTGVVAGTALVLLTFPTGSGAVFATGLAIAGACSVAGPASGWARAGYPNRALGGAALRLGIIGLSSTWWMWASDNGASSEWAVAALASGALTGVCLATLQAYWECDGIAPYVREHGAGGTKLTLAPCASPTGAPALALVAHF